MGPSSSRGVFLFFLVLTVVVELSGCGSTNSFGSNSSGTTSPTASTTPNPPTSSGSGGSGNGSGGGSTPAASDKLAPCNTPNNAGAYITGTIVDAMTGQPINGKALASIDFASGQWLNVNPAGTNGRWSSANLIIAKQNFTLTFSAVGADGTEYVPKVLVSTTSCPITQGVEVGTIALMPGTSATAAALVTAQSASGTAPQISERTQSLYLNYAGTDWAFALYPYLTKPQDLQTGGSCPSNTACLPIEVNVPASTPLAAMYNGASTQFAPVAAAYSLGVAWDGPTNGSPISYHCTPSPEARSTTQAVTSGARVNFGTLAFSGC